MKSIPGSAEHAIQCLDDLVLTIDIPVAIHNLDDLYDAFIRDDVTGNFTHEKRLKVHHTYRALEAFKGP